MDSSFDDWAAAGCPDDMPPQAGSMRVIPYPNQAKQSRASEIGGRLVSLGAIDAVLTSNYMVKGWLDRNCLSMLYGKEN
jgi:hypothetical protein